VSFWIVFADAILAYLGALAVLLSSEVRLLPRRRDWMPRLVQAWSRSIAIFAFLALLALVFAVMFSDVRPTLLGPMEITFATLAFTLCAWLWFRIARRSLLALRALAAVYAVAAGVFTAVWAASAMLGVGLALATPCALTIVGLAVVTVKTRESGARPHRRR
jgi:hypothetical protein